MVFSISLIKVVSVFCLESSCVYVQFSFAGYDSCSPSKMCCNPFSGVSFTVRLVLWVKGGNGIQVFFKNAWICFLALFMFQVCVR